MKQNIFKMFFVALAVALFASCTQNDDMLETIEDGLSNEAGYVYTLHLEGSAPVYSDDMTRASTTWKTGSEVSLRLQSGSSIVNGTAKYDGSKWTLTTDKKLSSTTSAAKCGALYYENATDLNSLTPSSIVYMGEGTYTASSTDIYVSVTMKPIKGRLRFKGQSGTRISLKGNMTCPKMMSASSDKLIWEASSYNFLSVYPVELKVNSNGYTDYIYVTFDFSGNWKNTLTIVNETEGNTYERLDIDGSILPVASSGFLTIPTSSNYTSLKWEKIDPNATVQTDFFVPLYNGCVTNWKMGSSAYSFYYGIYEISSNKEIVEDIVKEHVLYNVDKYKNNIFKYSDEEVYKSNTDYFLCTVAYNKNGERGPLYIRSFKTRSEMEPRAKISNLKATTSNGVVKWRFDASLVNGAVKYYGIDFQEKDDYESHSDFLVYCAYQYIEKGYYTSTIDFTSAIFDRTDNQCALVSVAVDSKGNICGYDVAKATTSSTRSSVQGKSNKSRKDATSTCIPEMIMRAKTTDMKFEPMLTPNINIMNKR